MASLTFVPSLPYSTLQAFALDTPYLNAIHSVRLCSRATSSRKPSWLNSSKPESHLNSDNSTAGPFLRCCLEKDPGLLSTLSLHCALVQLWLDGARERQTAQGQQAVPARLPVGVSPKASLERSVLKEAVSTHMVPGRP